MSPDGDVHANADVGVVDCGEEGPSTGTRGCVCPPVEGLVPDEADVSYLVVWWHLGGGEVRGCGRLKSVWLLVWVGVEVAKSRIERVGSLLYCRRGERNGKDVTLRNKLAFNVIDLYDQGMVVAD